MPITTSFRNYCDFTNQKFLTKYAPTNLLSFLSNFHQKNIHTHTFTIYDQLLCKEKLNPSPSSSPQNKSENKYLHKFSLAIMSQNLVVTYVT